MKIKIVKNKYFNTLFLLMLISAALHMIILTIIAFMEKSIFSLNYFHFLSFDYFFPNVFLNNFSGNLASIIFMAVFYFLILQINNGKNKK